MRRDISQGDFSGFAEPNPNTDFIGGRGFWLWYFISLVLFQIFLGVLLDLLPWTSSAYVWSVLHIGHALVTFFMMHYVTGLPFWVPDSQGKYDGQTFWEQIDNGRQFTSNRKVLSLIPVALFLLSTMETGWSAPLMFFNFFVLCVVALLPKSGAMDGFFAGKSSS